MASKSKKAVIITIILLLLIAIGVTTFMVFPWNEGNILDESVEAVEVIPGIWRRYIGKKIVDFPNKVDLSSPEKTQVTYVYARANEDIDALLKVFWMEYFTFETVGKMLQSKSNDEYKNLLPELKIIEVLTNREDGIAYVITYWPFFWEKYLPRRYILMEGEWRNGGDGGAFRSVQAARTSVLKKMQTRQIWKQSILEDANRMKQNKILQ